MLGEVNTVGNLAVRRRSDVFCNPVYDHYFADPFAFQHDGMFYAVGTCEAEFGLFPMLRSANLAEWERLGPSLAPVPDSLGTDFWAPEIACDRDAFYMYYSVGFGDKRHKLRVAR